MDDAVAYAKKNAASPEDRLQLCLDKLAVNFGAEISKHVTGYVSTEVDARLSFDAEASIAKARKLIAMYEEIGITRDRVLIKMATTWEGCQAAKVLEAEGIRCNMTLLFSFCQAVAAAEAGATLISPFVGRILDWYKKSTGKEYAATEDPGVLSVKRIYKYYKAHGIKTTVMGASFRNVGEVLELAGADKLTISPALLTQLQALEAEVPRKLSPEDVEGAEAKVTFTEATFRWSLNEEAMATEKLAEGIRGFGADLLKLEAFVTPLLA